MLILCDFDGVLNSVLISGSHQKLEEVTGFSDFEHTLVTVNGSQFSIITSQERNRMVRDLAKDNDLVWLTTWVPMGVIDKVCDFTGIYNGQAPEAKFHLSEIRNGINYYEWKLETAHSMISDERFVWIDDDCIPSEFHRENQARSEPGLLVTPDTQFGLTREQIRSIREYVEE